MEGSLIPYFFYYFPLSLGGFSSLKRGTAQPVAWQDWEEVSRREAGKSFQQQKQGGWLESAPEEPVLLIKELQSPYFTDFARSQPHQRAPPPLPPRPPEARNRHSTGFLLELPNLDW